MKTWTEYKTNPHLNEAITKIKTIEGAVDYALESSNNKKEALAFIDNSKDAFIAKNVKKIKDMLNKLPNSIF